MEKQKHQRVDTNFTYHISRLLAYFSVSAIMLAMSQGYSERVRRASTLIMLEWLVPLFVRKRTTDFLLPQIDPAWFTKLGIRWGVWRMSETEFSEFEKKMLKIYTETLSAVSPAFKDKALAKINEAMSMGIKLAEEDDMTQPQPEPQWQPIEKLPLIASMIEGSLEPAIELNGTLQEARQKPYSMDDALVSRIVKAYTNQREDLWFYDEQLKRWKAQKLTTEQKAEVVRLERQAQKLRELNTAILSMTEELQGLTIERLLEKDDAEVGLEYLLGTLGEPKKKPTKMKPINTNNNTNIPSSKKPKTAKNGLCECAGTTLCVNCRFCETQNTPAARKALCATIVNFLVFAPIYQHLVSKTLPTIFPNSIVYEDEKDIASMLFEAVIFDGEYAGETPLSYFLSHAPLNEDLKRLYKAWQTHNRYGFYIVQKIIPEKEIHLTDLSGQTAYKAYETRGTKTFKEGTVVIGRLVPFLDGWMIYTESIVSFANASPEWMKQSAHISIPQLIFIQRFRQDQELRHNN